MVSRIVPVILLALLAALHAQLWLGRGSVPRVNAMQRQIDVQKAANEQAIAAGVFGAPFFVVDGEPFWGNDRQAQIDAWLASGPPRGLEA